MIPRLQRSAKLASPFCTLLLILGPTANALVVRIKYKTINIGSNATSVLLYVDYRNITTH